MKKKILTTILSIICVVCFSLFFVACNSNENNTNNDDQILAVYNSYLAYAEENGQTPLSYEEWLASVKGEKGETGTNGVDGVSPKLQINTTTNMWEISYDDGKTWISLNVKATGSDGTNGTNGVDGVSPKLQINTTTNMWEISYDDGKTWTSLNVKATGSNGTNGVNGLSAYELFTKYNPTYNKTESEWLEDLVAGQLHVINITIDGNGGNVADSNIITKSNSYISVDIPTKNGYDFVGWSLNGSIIDINTYVFFTDCTLKAIWKDAEEVTINFNADSGIVSPVRATIEFGKNYSLPTPSKEYQTFAGWYYLDTLIPQTGVWEYTHEDITLTAKWNKTNIYANLSVDAEYGAVDKTKTTLAIGDYYTLPIPSSLKDGETFQGWYYGDKKVTDAQGKSFEKCTWDSTVTLTAAYYIEISTIYEFMDLAGKDLVGKYIITQDLDFKGLGINSINSLKGTFDGGGHTLKNFTLSTDASSNTYSGLFKTVRSNSTICNIVFENVNCSEEYASGLIGTISNSTIKNIIFKNSLNNCRLRSVLIGKVAGQETRYNYNTYTSYGEINVYNILIENSGNLAYSYGIYSQEATKESDPGNSGEYYHFYSNIYIDGFYLLNINNTNSAAGGVLYKVPGISRTASFDESYYPQREINISNLRIDGNIANGVVSRSTNDYKIYSQIIVEKAELNGTTKTAWSNVVLLKDSIHTGTTQSWGASKSIRCIDAGSEIGSYNLGAISSSIILYPDANGVFTYYLASGTMATFNDVSLIDKDLFISMLGFDETVWNLDNIDIENGKYPRIRS